MFLEKMDERMISLTSRGWRSGELTFIRHPRSAKHFADVTYYSESYSNVASDILIRGAIISWSLVVDQI